MVLMAGLTCKPKSPMRWILQDRSIGGFDLVKVQALQALLLGSRWGVKQVRESCLGHGGGPELCFLSASAVS